MRERKQWSFVCLLLFNSVSTVYHIWCRLTAAEHQAIKCTLVALFFFQWFDICSLFKMQLSIPVCRLTYSITVTQAGIHQ